MPAELLMQAPEANCFSALSTAFANRIQELKQLTHLRIEDSAKDLFEQDLIGLEASVSALERQLAEIKVYIKKETDSLPKVEALAHACKLQNQDLLRISSNLPPHLPGGHGTVLVSRLDAAKQHATAIGGQNVQNASSSANNAKQDDGAVKKRHEPVPRWYVTDAELQSLSSYMRGRLTLDKVNAAVDEIAGHSEANHKLLATARNQASKLALADRKRAAELLHAVANKEGIKGRPWFLEQDLKEGVSLKLDKTGKSILTILRHLGRVQEVRCSVEGTSTILYILQSPT